MIFAIRDDDINFFTKPEELEEIYNRIWEVCPVSFSVVPFHACTKSGAIPREYWEGDQLFPIGDNIELVKFLREKVREGKACIMLHGYSHKDEADGYEFEAGRDLEYKVREGKKYLEQLFGVRIRIFVPPHNALSKAAWEAVVKNGLHICGFSSPRKRGWHGFEDIVNFVRRKYWKTIRHLDYPFLLRYPAHMEFGFHPLTPAVRLYLLEKRLSLTAKYKGVFVLATHHWELGQEFNNSRDSLKDGLTRLVTYATDLNAKMCTLEELIR